MRLAQGSTRPAGIRHHGDLGALAGVEPRLHALVLMSGGATPVAAYAEQAPAELREDVTRILGQADPLRLVRKARPGSLLYVAIGAGMMGIWSSTLFGSGGAIQWQRWQGTLELLVAAPMPIAWVLLPVTTAMATVGLYSMAATLLWGRILFGIDVHIAHPWQFALSVPVTVLAIGMMGFLLSVTVDPTGADSSGPGDCDTTKPSPK